MESCNKKVNKEQFDDALEKIATVFHQAYYYNAEKTWHQTKWQGHTILKCPLDMWIYQEILFETKPDLIIETGTYFGGSALYLAHLCDIMNHGEIITVDITAHDNRPMHERITYLVGSSVEAHILETLTDYARNKERVMVILDSDHSQAHVLDELRKYYHFVSSGCYLIVEDTNVHGHPVYVEHGPGPMEAVKAFLEENDNFVIDKGREKFMLSFNPNGYLKKNNR